MWARALAMTCASAALACAGAPKPVPAPMPTSSEGATGEVIFVVSGSIGAGASFSDHSVTGPSVNMATTPEGVWGGDLRGLNFLLDISEGRIGAAALELQVNREGDALDLDGIFGGRRVRVQLSPRRLHGFVDGGACSFDLAGQAPGTYHGIVSCPPRRGEHLPAVSTASLRLTGDAARLDQPVLPQMALALLAVLPP